MRDNENNFNMVKNSPQKFDTHVKIHQ